TPPVRPRESGDPGATSPFTRVFNGLSTRTLSSLGPRLPGGERGVFLCVHSQTVPHLGEVVHTRLLRFVCLAAAASLALSSPCHAQSPAAFYRSKTVEVYIGTSARGGSRAY